MAIEDRARGYVERANAALGDLERAQEIWDESVRSSTDEMRIHSLSIPLDHAIRKVEGPFENWASVDPAAAETIAEQGPRKLFQLLSAHSNGRVREAFVHCAAGLPNDQVLPHLANRTIDFVPTIRQLATPIVIERLAEEAAQRSTPGSHGPLNTSTHIAVSKLLAPRTAFVSPELIGACIEVALTTTAARPGALKEHALEQMLRRCHQTELTVTEPKSRQALADLIAYFEANAIT